MRDDGKSREELLRELEQARRRIAVLERVKAELAQAHADLMVYERLVSISPDFVSLVDSNYVYRVVNDAYVAASGKRREDIIGRTVADFLGKERFEAHSREHIDRCLRGEKLTYEGWFEFPRTGRMFMRVSYLPFRNNGGDITGVMIRAHDITKWKKAEEELEKLARTDSLTGVANLRHFRETAACEIARAKRHGQDLSLLMLDLDEFKAVNDTYGHDIGDTILKIFVALCRESLRESDIVGRVGGEEFAVLLPETAPEDAVHVAERIRRKAASAVIPTERGPVSFSVSIGVAGFTDGEECVRDLMKKADQALYLAKQRGRNRVERSCASEKLSPSSSTT